MDLNDNDDLSEEDLLILDNCASNVQEITWPETPPHDFDLTEEDLLLLDNYNVQPERNTDPEDLPQEFTQNTQWHQAIADFFDDEEPPMEHLECLKSKFHHGEFRAKQWEIIKAIEEKRDLCAVMATGYGKSLCYQFPAVYSRKMTLVISPLISLMQAQVMDLADLGISACYLGTAQKDPHILDKIAQNNFTVVYCSPEYLQTRNGDRLLSIVKKRLVLVAIDEAHCVSQWGHDFRPDFRKLHLIREKLPNIPILAMTATATENVRHDIITLLRLNQPRVIITSFDRSNLEFIIRHKTTPSNDLVRLIKDTNGSVIVYVLKRKVAEEIAAMLRVNGIHCEHYHAGIPDDVKTKVLEDFRKDVLKVIVATIAFGMGIDKKDVRCVVHYGASKNLESYYQEVGRAGRDGKWSKVITFFSPGDFELHDWFLEEESAKWHLSAIIKNYLRSLAAKMRDFLYSTQCRRKTILEYFGEHTALLPRPNCCDNCTIGLGSWKLTDLYKNVDDNGIYDFAVEARLLLQAIKCLQQKGIATDKNLVKKFLIGKVDQQSFQLRSVRYDRAFGSGRMKPDHHWLALIEQLTQNEFIEKTPNTTSLVLTTTADDWLRSGVSLPLKAIGQMFEYFEKKSSTPLVADRANRYTVTRAVTDLLRKEYVSSDEMFKQILHTTRDAIAVAKNVLKDSIASMAELDRMVKVKPNNTDELRYSLVGTSFNEEKLNKYGPTFVNSILKFTKAELEMQNVLLNHPMPNVNMDRMISPQILRLLKDRKPMEQILTITNLTADQLHSDIETLIKTGQPVLKTDLAYGSQIDFKVFSQQIGSTSSHITPEWVEEIESRYCTATGQHIASGFARLALAYYAVRFHLNGISVPYIDCEDNDLVHADKLIVDERQETLNSTFSTDRQYPSIARSHYHAGSIIEFLFGDLGDYYHPYDESDSEHQFHMDEDLGSVESYDEDDGSDDGDESNEEEDNEESEQENEQETDEDSGDESNVASDGGNERSEEGDETDDELQEESATDTSEDESHSDSDYENQRGIYSRKRRRI